MDDSPAPTGALQASGRFMPGVSGNPAGRKKGSRNKINETFLSHLQELWEAQGAEILRVAADTEPMQFAKMMSTLLPKDVSISVRPFTEFSDDDLRSILERLEAADSTGALGGGTTLEGEATRVVSALPETAGVPQGGEDVPRARLDGGESGGEDDLSGS